jgi:hypothetical protein
MPTRRHSLAAVKQVAELLARGAAEGVEAGGAEAAQSAHGLLQLMLRTWARSRPSRKGRGSILTMSCRWSLRASSVMTITERCGSS